MGTEKGPLPTVFATNCAIPLGLACPVTLNQVRCPDGCQAYVADTGVENDDIFLKEPRTITITERRELKKDLNQHLSSIDHEVRQRCEDGRPSDALPVPSGDNHTVVGKVVSVEPGDVADFITGFDLSRNADRQ